MHAEFTRRPALVALVLLENSQDEPFLELPYRFGIKDVASVHLQYERFELIFHRGSLFYSASSFSLFYECVLCSVLVSCWGSRGHFLTLVTQ